MPASVHAAYIALWLVTAAGLGAGLWIVHRRASRARQTLSQELHDRALALDRRCDHLQEQLEKLARRQRVDHLMDLIDFGDREGRLAPEAARELRRFAHRLREESLAGGEGSSR